MDRKTTGVENWKPHESPEIVSLIKNFQKKILVSRTIRADKREKKKLFGKRDTLFAVGVCVFPKKRRQKKKNFRRNFPSHQQRRQWKERGVDEFVLEAAGLTRAAFSLPKKKIGRDTANELELAVGLEEDEPTKNIPPIIRIIISAVERDATVEEKEV